MAKSNRHYFAPEVYEMAEKMIFDDKDFRHLQRVRMDYLHCEKPIKKRGSEVLGLARVVRGRASFRACQPEGRRSQQIDWRPGIPFFEILISLDVWEAFDGFDLKRMALIDHELRHCGIEWDEDDPNKIDKAFMIGHDIEEMNGTVKKYGVWLDDVRLFKEALDAHGQMSMNLDGQAEGGPAVSAPLRFTVATAVNGGPKSDEVEITIPAGRKAGEFLRETFRGQQ